MRLQMAAVNQGFLGEISQSAKSSRGSRSGGSFTLVLSGSTAEAGFGRGGAAGALVEAAAGAEPLSGSQKTTSSFHSRVGL